ncbi:hypothetical protein OG900_29215 [Streptomyces sp. NBC_00433]
MPYERTTRGFRQRLLEISLDDGNQDPRDMMVDLHELCAEARGTGVGMRSLLLDVAGLSSDVDTCGMGSTRHILLRATEMDPVGLW